MQVLACTGITLKAADGAVVYGRTMEWGSFDLHSRVVVVPRGYKYAGHTPDDKPGLVWQAKYGVVGLDAVDKDMLVDGMNEGDLRSDSSIIQALPNIRRTSRPMRASRWRRPISASISCRPVPL